MSAENRLNSVNFHERFIEVSQFEPASSRVEIALL